ncbi:MAG: HAD-IIA family hydrolase [Dehalococcoidia bacterium]|nr:HAD-IIA family hydrolase [Dehalococcoidia bacterium]MDW7983038.1 HAD-IIA family hydrolase [Thermomicrobium sp.]
MEAVPPSLTSRLLERPLVFDVDGTLVLADSEQWNDPHPLPAARELLQRLRARGHPFLLLTNGTARTPSGYAARLRAAGLDVDGDRLLTPAVVAAELLATQLPGEPVFVLGHDGSREPLAARGIPLLDRSEAHRARVVFVGWAPALTYEDLAAAARAIWQGAEFWTAVVARALAAHGGRAPAMGGALMAAVAHVTDTRPRLVGKPAPDALAVAARALGVRPSDLVMVGDDLEIDISMAKRAGAHSILVRTGTGRHAQGTEADVVLETLAELLALVPPVEDEPARRTIEPAGRDG